MTAKMKEISGKARSCLAGVAIGDALGMATEFLTPDQIRRKFSKVKKFERAPAGHPNSSLKAGQVTDDTMETLVVANCLIKHGRITAGLMADELIQWAKEKSVLESPFVGPSTKLGIRRLLDGENPMKAGRDGVTNGACMRVSPIGIANIGKIKNCIEETAQACMPTHGTSIAISGASAVSCSIAEAMRDEATVDSIIEAAKIGARRGARLGRIFPHPSIDRKIEMCVQIAGRFSSAREMCREIYEVIGTGLSPVEAVPSAFAIFAKFGGMFKEAVITAANIGGDTDTIASIVGAITGAFAGVRTIPAKWLEIVKRKNSLNLGYYASKLAKVALRRLGTSDYEKRQQI